MLQMQGDDGNKNLLLKRQKQIHKKNEGTYWKFHCTVTFIQTATVCYQYRVLLFLLLLLNIQNIFLKIHIRIPFL